MKSMEINSREHLLAMIKEETCYILGKCRTCWLDTTCKEQIFSQLFHSIRKQVALDLFISVYGEAELFEELL